MRGLIALVVMLLVVAAGPQQRVAAEAAHNVRGIHMLAPASPEEAATHLGWAQLLVGNEGYVTQPFSAVSAATGGPTPEAVHFVERAYALGLTPIVKLQGGFSNQSGCDPSTQEGWSRPVPDQPGSAGQRYRAEAAGYRTFVAGLPLAAGRSLYVEVGNEPNLHYMWGGAADPVEYARFFVEVSAAIRSLGDDRIRVLNAGLAPQGDVDNLAFIRAAVAAEPGFGSAFDAWASHPYPHNQPPQHNLHDGTALPGSRNVIDAYLLELQTLRDAGVDTTGLRVMLTETGYELGDRWYPEYPPITEDNRAEYTRRAFADYWSRWPEVQAVTPFELSDPNGSWRPFDWIWPSSTTNDRGFPTRPHLHYARLIAGTGVVRGSVTDGAGHPVKGATVVPGASGHWALTVDDGSYVLITEPGSYQVSADRGGYEPVTAGPVEVVVGEVARLDLVLHAAPPSTVQNPSFETGDMAGWTVWGDVDGAHTGLWYDVSPRHKDYFLGTASNCGQKDGGVYQTVAAQAGRGLRLGAWVLTAREGDTPIGSRIGVDPAGGSDPNAGGIVWSDWTETDGKWRKVTVSATAAAEHVTIFLQHRQHATNRWNISAFDAVELGRSD